MLGLKKLFIQSEIKKIKDRLVEYEEIFKLSDVKDLSLRRLISIKQREKNLLENMLKNRNG